MNTTKITDTISNLNSQCCLDFDKSAEILDGDSVTNNGITFDGGNLTGTLCWNSLTPSADLPSTYFIYLDNETSGQGLKLNISAKFTNGNVFRFTNPNGDCYEGKLEKQDPERNVFLKISSEPTTPTPQPQKLEFRWHSVQGREILQVKNILKPTNSNFAGRDTFSTWSTLYGFVADSSFYSLDHATWPDASVDTNYESVHNTTSFDGLNFSFGEAENSNGVDYIQLKLNGHISNKTEFLPKVNVSTPCDLFIFAGDNNDPNNSATLDNSAWPVIAKQLEATPTPKPTSDCSPETHTTFHAPAKGETYAYTYTYPDTGKVTTFFTVQGFTNGKVAIDVSLPNNWSENSLATKYYVYLPEGNIIGTVQKMLINQSNMFYYMSSEKCYYGELTGSSTRIDLKEKDGYVAPDACCESNSLKLQVSGGKTSSAVDTITVQADPLGSMDGTLCWPEIGGYTTAQQYNVKFEDAPSDRSTIVINVQNNVSNVKFRYEHKSGSCFEGYLISTGTSTFKKI